MNESWDEKQLIKEGEIAEIVGISHFHHIIKIQADQEIQTHKGIIYTNDFIGRPWGSIIHSHNGNKFYVIQPALTDMIKNIPRETQIVYPKDVGFILLNLAIGPGKRIIEAGTGSGALTTAFAYSAGSTGKVYSYDSRADFQKLAEENLKRVALDEQVEFITRDIRLGFTEKNVDALFLDIPDPYNYLAQVRDALKPGGFFGCLLPTANQVILLLEQMNANQFGFTEVCETGIRYYQTEAERFRPVDRMIAHTGFLIFGRPLIKDENLMV